MPIIHKGQECLSLEEFETHMHQFTRESAKEIPALLRARQAKIDNYELSI